MIITKKSNLSGKESTMNLNVTPEQLGRWNGGELIQNVFPHLTTVEREFLMTGITKTEWNAVFGE